MNLAEHPTVRHFYENAGRLSAPPSLLDAVWLRQLCLDCGADDAGLVEISRQFFADRMKRTVTMDRPLLLGADGFRYPVPLRYQEHDLDEELDLVAVTRRQMARTLRLVASDAWQRTAVHSETGLVTLRQLLLHAINHLHHHLRFVAEKRAAMTTP